ncbi:MAG: M13 family metallopeptidase [Pseudomarimonas sp.]
MKLSVAALVISLTLSLGGPAAALELRDLDPKTPACKDFYQFANGGWLKATPVPAERESFGTFDVLQERNRAQQEALLAEILQQPKDNLDVLIADFVSAGLDEAGIEAAGLTPIAGLLAEIDALKKPKQLPALLASWHARGLPVAWRFDAGDDLRQPDQVIAYATQGGLVLPDRDYYLRQDPDTRELLGHYRGYAQALLTLAGSSDPAGDSARALAMEIRLAGASLDLLQLRDPNTSYQPISTRDLFKRYPAMQWKQFLKAQGQGKLKAISVAPIAFFDTLEQMLSSTPLEDWKPYLRLQLLDALAPYLSSGFVTAHDGFHGALLAGQTTPPDRTRRVLAAADLALGDAVGQRYVARYLPAPAQAGAKQVVDDVRAALRLRLASAPWLSEASRLAAVDKLDALDLRLAAPTEWRSFEGLTLSRSSYAGNVMAAAALRNRQRMAAIGGKRSTELFPLPTQLVNGYYAPNRNQLVLSAGLLQAPLFDPAADAAENYGALGAMIGHELMQGFDVTGQLFDKKGALLGGWTVPERDAFLARTKPLETQYDAYTAIGAIKVSGRLTRSKNTADLAGLELAHAALRTRIGDLKLPQAQGYTPEQRFFLSYARLWRRNDLEPALIRRLSTDVHAPPRQRVNGPLVNMPEFAAAFACKANDPMNKKAAEQVRIWAAQ